MYVQRRGTSCLTRDHYIMYYELARILLWTPYGILYQSASCERERISFLQSAFISWSGAYQSYHLWRNTVGNSRVDQKRLNLLCRNVSSSESEVAACSLFQGLMVFRRNQGLIYGHREHTWVPESTLCWSNLIIVLVVWTEYSWSCSRSSHNQSQVFCPV
jgi:hypothetical protein